MSHLDHGSIRGAYQGKGETSTGDPWLNANDEGINIGQKFILESAGVIGRIQRTDDDSFLAGSLQVHKHTFSTRLSLNAQQDTEMRARAVLPGLGDRRSELHLFEETSGVHAPDQAGQTDTVGERREIFSLPFQYIEEDIVPRLLAQQAFAVHHKRMPELAQR